MPKMLETIYVHSPIKMVPIAEPTMIKVSNEEIPNDVINDLGKECFYLNYLIMEFKLKEQKYIAYLNFIFTFFVQIFI